MDLLAGPAFARVDCVAHLPKKKEKKRERMSEGGGGGLSLRDELEEK